MAGSTVSRRLSEFIGVALFALAVIWLIALASYSASDPVWFFNTGSDLPPVNFAGRIGAFMAELSYQLVGYSAYLIPIVLVVVGWHYFWCRVLDAAYTKLIGAALLLGCTSAFLALAFGTIASAGTSFRSGGYAGEWLAGLLSAYLNRTGSIILILTLLFLAVILSTQFSFGRLFAAVGQLVRDRWTTALGALARRREEKRREKQRQDVLKKHLGSRAPAEVRAKISAAPPEPVVARGSNPPAPVEEVKKPSRTAAMVGAATAALKAASSRPTPPPPIRRPTPVEPPLPLVDAERVPAERRKGAYIPPPLALLDAPKGERKIDERELMEGARQLEEKCREFGVEGSVVQIHPGPVVTTYEFKPDAGVKYSKITGLADDLCLAMQAESVLIDRIPGKSTVGIQIPNPNRELIVDARAARIGCVQAVGLAAHARAGQDDPRGTVRQRSGDDAASAHCRIDRHGQVGQRERDALQHSLPVEPGRGAAHHGRPKRLELGMYEGIPHLLTPVVVDPKLAANALRWAVREMEERYKTLAAVGVRNIEQYNRNLKLAQAEKKGPVTDDNGNEVKPLPFIVVLIDELADLMMVAGNEVEESICRLAQMARAVGIHLILATQRPSVDVITGLIKANLPARISFRVSSKIDSRTILDGNGAEQLLGKGDMLYLPPASSRFVRLHGPYISEQESARLASFLRKQGKPNYDHSITEDDKKAACEMEFEKDDLYDEAARIVVSSGQASISLSPAAAANRIQPRRAAGGHDGGGRARVRRGGRQSA